MKKIVLIVFMVIMAGVACGQEVVQYPYHCYMEWTMPLPMDSMYYSEPNNMDGWRMGAYGVTMYKDCKTRAREFVVDTPTTIYGIALTLWGQDTARRDVAATIMSCHKQRVTRLKEVRWFDSMPFRYVVFEARDCWRQGDTIHYIDTVKAYEFYFDTPVVVSDTFLVGYHTLGIDGRQHEWQGDNIDSTGYVYLASKQGVCDNSYPRPVWYFISNNMLGNPRYSKWAGVLPIIVEPPCNPDTLTCAMVPEMVVTPLDNQQVEFSWLARPEQQDFQISVGLQGTPPDSGHLFAASASPLVLTDNWDTTATYVAYIRARCERHCDSSDVLVWSDWTGPVSFFGYQPQDPIGIAMPDGVPALFTITPNPTHDAVTVRTAAYSTSGTAVLTLRDAAGRELLVLPVTSPSLTIPLQGYPSGTYLVTLSTSQATSTQRLVVE